MLFPRGVPVPYINRLLDQMGQHCRACALFQAQCPITNPLGDFKDPDNLLPNAGRLVTQIGDWDRIRTMRLGSLVNDAASLSAAH